MVEITNSGGSGGSGYSYVLTDIFTVDGDGQSATPLKNKFSQLTYLNTDSGVNISINKQGNYINTEVDNTISFLSPIIQGFGNTFPAVSGLRVLVYTNHKLNIGTGGLNLPVYFQGAISQKDTLVGQPMTQINEKKVYEFLYVKSIDSGFEQEYWLCLNTLAVPVNSYDLNDGRTFDIIYYGVFYLYDTNESGGLNFIKLPAPSLFDGMKISIINKAIDTIEFGIDGTPIPEYADFTTQLTTMAVNQVLEIISTNGKWVIINYTL